MSQFNYFVVPTVSVPSIYYINIPSITSIETPRVETTTQINSESNLRTSLGQKSNLELSRE